jgi:hypothetical protein
VAFNTETVDTPNKLDNITMPSIRSLLIASTLLIGAVFAQEAPEAVVEQVKEEAPVGKDLGQWTFSGGQVVISAKGQTARVTEE